MRPAHRANLGGGVGGGTEAKAAKVGTGSAARWWRPEQQARQQWQQQQLHGTPQPGQPFAVALSLAEGSLDEPLRHSPDTVPPGIANLGNSCFLAAALQALAGVDPLWDEASWLETGTGGRSGQIARELWDVVSKLRQGGRRGGVVQPARLLEFLQEAAPALAGQGAQDALECLEALTSLRELRYAALIVSRVCISCPDPLGDADAAALGLSI